MSIKRTYESLRDYIKLMASLGRIGPLTDEERADWAYGNAKLSNYDVTREMAERAVASGTTSHLCMHMKVRTPRGDGVSPYNEVLLPANFGVGTITCIMPHNVKVRYEDGTSEWWHPEDLELLT